MGSLLQSTELHNAVEIVVICVVYLFENSCHTTCQDEGNFMEKISTKKPPINPRNAISETSANAIELLERSISQETQRQRKGGIPKPNESLRTYGDEDDGFDTILLSSQFLTCFFASWTGFLLGTCIAFTSVALPELREWKMKSIEENIISSSLYLTQGFTIIITFPVKAAGSIAAGWIMEPIGEKIPLFIGIFPFAIGWGLFIIAYYTQSIWIIIVGRIIHGLCSGIIIPISDLYEAETSHRRIRGMTIAAFMIQLALGTLAVYIIGYFLTLQWLSLTILLVTVAPVPLFLYVPESPYWYIERGRNEEGRAALTKIRGEQYIFIDEEIKEIQQHVDEARRLSTTWNDIFSFKCMWPMALLTVIIFLRQFSGEYALLYFTKDIFAMAESGIDEGLSSIIIGIVKVSAALASAVLFDVMGRKVCVTISSLIMGFSIISVGTFHYVNEHPELVDIKDDIKTNTSWYYWYASFLEFIPIVGFSLFVIGFDLGVATGIFILMVEMIPLQIKNYALGFSHASNSLCGFLHITTFKLMTDWSKAGTFWIFGICCFLLAAVVYVCISETKGMSLKAIQDQEEGQIMRGVDKLSLVISLPGTADTRQAPPNIQSKIPSSKYGGDTTRI